MPKCLMVSATGLRGYDLYFVIQMSPKSWGIKTERHAYYICHQAKRIHEHGK